MLKRIVISRFAPIIFIVASGIIVLNSCKTPSSVAKSKKPDTAVSIESFYAECSSRLGVKLSGAEDKALLEEIVRWLGTPYKYGGNTTAGTDCSGFTGAVFKKVYEIGLYRSSADQIKNTESVKKENLLFGDLVFFKISGSTVSHVGIYIGSNKFVHASTTKGVVVNDLAEAYYAKYYYTAGRVKKSP